MRIRAVRSDDHAAILALANKAGIGMTSLPPDEEVLARKIDRAVKSFSGESEHPADESYLFVLEDPDEDNEVVGTCGIIAHVGLRQPFYSYKISTITQSSKEQDIYSMQKILSVVNDYTGSTEIGSLFLLPEYRRDRIGRFLSRMRFLFIAEFREQFDKRIIAEIRGVHDRDGNSPFYNSIAKHFFQMEFMTADYINATQGNQFITDLMPKYPMYVNLLPKSAQEVIGQPFPSSEAAKAMLEREGFRYNEYLDVFDGGPTVESFVDDVKTVKASAHAEVMEIADLPDGEKSMVMNTNMHEFYAVVGRVELVDGGVRISTRVAKSLDVQVGDHVRHVSA